MEQSRKRVQGKLPFDDLPSAHEFQEIPNLPQPSSMNPSKTLLILPELRRFIPPLLPTERAFLKSSIEKEGCTTPLIVWRRLNEQTQQTELVLVDGHNRKAICEELGKPYQIEERTFEDLGAVRAFMSSYQLARRNLGALQKAYMIGAHYESLKKNALDNLQKRNKQAITTQEDSHQQEKNTAHWVGRLYGVDESTVKRYYALYSAMHHIETLNADALVKCFELLNSKELQNVRWIAQAGEESIKAIRDEKTLREAIRTGKNAAKTPKVQNEPSKEKKDKLEKERKLQDTIHNQKRALEKQAKTIEQLQNSLQKQEKNAPRAQDDTASEATIKDLEEKIRYLRINLEIIQYAQTMRPKIYSFDREKMHEAGFTIYKLYAHAIVKWNPQMQYWYEHSRYDTPQEAEEAMYRLLDDEKAICEAVSCFVMTAEEVLKRENETLQNLLNECRDAPYTLAESIKNRIVQEQMSMGSKAIALMKLGFNLYRHDSHDKCIKQMNEKGAWTKPKHLRFATKAETERAWYELMKDEKNLPA